MKLKKYYNNVMICLSIWHYKTFPSILTFLKFIHNEAKAMINE